MHQFRLFLVLSVILLSGWFSSVAQTPYTVQLHTDDPSMTLTVQPETETTCTVVVKNGQGKFVESLKPEHFGITRNNRAGTITSVIPLSATRDAVFRVVLVIDNSASMLPRLDRVLADMDVLMDQLSNDIGISVVSFSEDPILLKEQQLYVNASPFLYDIAKVKNIYTTSMRKNYTSRTFLYDAVYAASTLLKEGNLAVGDKKLKTFVILLSDGRDIGSEVSAEKALAQIYTGGNAPVFFTIDYMTSTNKFLRTLAEKTGGKYYAAKRADDLAEILASVAHDTYAAGYRVSFAWRNPPEITFTSKVPEQITIEKSSVNEAFPLLPYVFFENSSADIPSRYRLLNAEQTAGFDQNMLPSEAMEYYYNVLNIIGSRLRTMPQAKLTITGCNAHTGSEQDNLALSQNRAETVARYLTEIWGIDRRRLTVEQQNLPSAPSRSTDEITSSENRRVELSSSTWEIVKPVVFDRTTYAGYGTDSMTTVSASVQADVGIHECRWQLSSQSTSLLAVSASSTSLPSLSLNWSEVFSRATPNGAINLTLAAVTNTGDTTSRAVRITPVVKTGAELGKVQVVKDRISLMLFDFNRADINGNNVAVMKEFVYPRLKPGSVVVVRGYTDDIGDEDVNTRLSERRAASVGTSVRSAVSLHDLRTQGLGETAPAFTNTVPEGRFYNRTVVISIETPAR